MSMQKFLLHACCAPCSIAVIDYLKNQFDVTVFFYNPNIHPEEEYLKRKKEVIRVCTEWSIPMIDMDYEVEAWRKVVKGLEQEREGGKRCGACIRLRLDKTARYAREHGFDIFCTSLTSGRNKKASTINPMGDELGDLYGVSFYEADWKTNGLQEKANNMITDRAIYRQKYCGCIYSKNPE